MNLLTENVKFSSAVTPTAGAAGTTAIASTILDMAGYDAVCIVVRFGAITATAVTSIKASQGNASDMSDTEDIAGSAQTIADTDDDKTFYIDLRPTKRYVQLNISRGTANAVVASALFLQYRGHSVPVTQGSNVSGEQFPIVTAGTA